MLRRSVLGVLSAAIDEGDEASLRTALVRLDPLLRGRARQALTRALSAAERAAPSAPAVEKLKRAYLVIASDVADAYGEAPSVEAAYEAARGGAPRPWRAWWASLGVALTALAVAFFFVARGVIGKPFDPAETRLGRTLARDVPAYLVTLDRASASPRPTASADLDRARDEVVVDAGGELGAEGSRRLRALLDASTELALATDDAPLETRTDPFFAAAGQLDGAFEAAHLPYFVDADAVATRRPSGVEPLLLSFYLERELETRVGDANVRVLYLWRLDHLNWKQSYLGYTRPRTPAALVLLDQIETELVLYVLPAVAQGEPVELFDDESRDPDAPWQAALEQRAGEVVRTHFEGLSRERAADVTRIGVLLARRRALVRKWRNEVAGLGMRLRVPERLIPEGDYATDLDARIPRAELAEWNAMHDELASTRLEGAFVVLRNVYALSVERHEVQHRYDFTRGLVPVPEPLAAYLGRQNRLDAPMASLAGRSRDELSAYLAQLADGDTSTLVDLTLLTRFVFAKDFQSTPYGYAALVALDEIANELTLARSGPIVSHGGISRQRAAELYLALSLRDAAEVRLAARRAWERLYEDALPAFSRGTSNEYQPWRR